jgi:dienelactone hydrolase
MNRLRTIIYFLFSCFFLSKAVAQTKEVLPASKVYHFTKGLLINAPARYGREALYTDELAYKLYTNTLRTPMDGENFGKDDKGQAMIWKAVTADSANRLFLRGQGRGGFGRSGYIYLTYNSEKNQAALLNIKGNSTTYFNGAPHTGDPYSSDWLYIPVNLKKGLNEFFVRGTFIVADLLFPAKEIFLNTEDATMPFIVAGADNKELTGAVVLINTTKKELRGLKIKSSIGGKEMTTDVPAVPSMSTRKISFNFDGTGINGKGKYDCQLSLSDSKGKLIDETKISIESVNATEQYSNTFVSAIDGSLQYYAVTPQSISAKENSALFLSVHGAGVEAIGQARAYKPKDWGNLVAATNRRPRGFNWEDWGRIDALEVLAIAKQRFKPNPEQIYLTGHSMGGHGTWFLGATYPDKWAAIAACAGYPTLKGYGSADGLIPDSAGSAMEKMLLRSGNQSDVIKLAQNYKPLGVYVFHGDDDRTVSVNYARQMRKILGEFHPDLSYYEYPGGGHWFGDQSVDWKPIFDFFKWHALAVDSAVNNIDFITANPGISSSFRWAGIQQQQFPLEYTRIQLKRNKTDRTITGSTENVRLLKLQLNDFGENVPVKILLDGADAVSYTTLNRADSIYLLKDAGKWTIVPKPSPSQKGPHRYGTFKDAFNHRMIFVYGTSGNKEENEWSFNKARYDAETWYYRGNGAVDIISDKEFSLAKYKDRGVILFGNKSINSAWKILLSECPIQVERNKITAGSKQWTGDDLAAYFVWPIPGSSIASVGVISGSGIKGMKAANANQYFAGASGFPDFMIFHLDMLQTGAPAVKFAGFFDNNWKLDSQNMVENN